MSTHTPVIVEHLGDQDGNIVSDFAVSDFISDHRVLHGSLQCIRPHPVRKQDNAIAENLDKFMLINGMPIEQYDEFISDLLHRHAPKNNIYVVDRPLNEWMTDNILTLKAFRRKNELIGRKTHTTINFDIIMIVVKLWKNLFLKENQN